MEIGEGVIFPADQVLADKACDGCRQHLRCLAGEGIPITIRDIRHLYVPDYKELWTLFIDLPDCKQVKKAFSQARMTAHLNTGNKRQIEGKIIESRISQPAELDIVDI